MIKYIDTSKWSQMKPEDQLLDLEQFAVQLGYNGEPFDVTDFSD